MTRAEQLQAERRARKEASYQRVKQLAADGFRVSAIVNEVGLSYRTVRKYMAA